MAKKNKNKYFKHTRNVINDNINNQPTINNQLSCSNSSNPTSGRINDYFMTIYKMVTENNQMVLKAYDDIIAELSKIKLKF